MEKELSLRRSVFKNVESPDHIKICVPPTTSYTTVGDSIFQSNDARTDVTNNPLEWKTFPRRLKIFLLILVWLVCSYTLMVNNEKIQDMHQISIQEGSISSYVIFKNVDTLKVNIILEGAILPAYYGNLSTNRLSVWIQLLAVKKKPRSSSDIKSSDVISMRNVSDVWMVPVVNERLIGMVPEVKSRNTFNLELGDADNTSFTFLRLQFKSNLKVNIPILMGFNLQPISPDDGIIYAALLLIGLYVLIILEILHRSVAAMLASTICVAILASLNARPTLHEIVSWMDIETLLLLFSMMVIVTIFSETRIFDFLAFWTFKKTNGNVWSLISILFFLVTLLSCFLDSVTTALLITPGIIKLCEVMKINPVTILTITIIIGNIGGAITPIGDPPNVIIVSHPEVTRSGVNFGIFTMHMGIGIILTLAVVYGLLRFIYRKPGSFQFVDCREVQDLKRSIAVLQRTASSVSSYSKDEEAVKKTLKKKQVRLQDMLKTTKRHTGGAQTEHQFDLDSLSQQNAIRNKGLLIKSGLTLLMVISVLFLHSIPRLNRLGMGWTSLLGALLLLLLYDDEDIEGIFARVEWCTLIFFASLFVLMEGLSKLGLIDFIGNQTQLFIMAVSPEARLTVAIILMLWVSAFVSAFVDNLPLTTMMVRVAIDLANNPELKLPLQPLIWALSFGACVGGNGSLLGSSSNIICAGVAEQHGYKFSILDFFKVGVPVTFISLLVISIYLIICHVVLSWH